MDMRERINEIIVGVLQAPTADLRPETEFRSLPNADSMNVLQIVLETENAFGIEIDDDVTFSIQTVGQYYDMVAALREQSTPA